MAPLSELPCSELACVYVRVCHVVLCARAFERVCGVDAPAMVHMCARYCFVFCKLQFDIVMRFIHTQITLQ